MWLLWPLLWLLLWLLWLWLLLLLLLLLLMMMMIMMMIQHWVTNRPAQDWTFHRYFLDPADPADSARSNQFAASCANFTPLPTNASWAAYRAAKAELLGRAVAALNAAGKVPLFSCSGGTSANTLAKCPNQAGRWAEEDYLAEVRRLSGNGTYAASLQKLWAGSQCTGMGE